ncbi:NAD(P)-dependent oxidoreductase [Myxococcus llanfairpwllgwyngyllgogerychwyrndrobwllllantysiliogogogochensis]|uniref:NAD(P)-dependent oxidoreductase n=1 Tax=Myxococcus llanfairpwllgwyngyllgogerychwyrndrobwllllantysiliogogogochensis TaxID=2590453 RepID=A0A540WS78_9BACT|nr:NAD(P)-dependent oxidoreductase [Myxococcus llanfairpwllgwyngyllgogerychwyrndrobwllllantysiliogogogochensis]TQF11875.1 NAD(P)-dependent oxidoreductase [Myxococcus llanfairpwllgwyngyllgogerychwyrndrobwllllantysiliogogogochensis]
MSSNPRKPVLIIGGSGVVGSLAAKALRRLQPDLPLTIGGRDVSRAQAVAREVGLADATTVDLSRPDLGQPSSRAYSAVVLFVKDDTLNSLRYAQAHGLPYLGISTSLFEVAPEVALYMHQPTRSPILLGSAWLVGAAMLPALQFAREFRALESIAIGAVLDEQDVGGAAAYADLDRQSKATPNTLILENGQWRWVGGDAALRTFRDGEGQDVQGQAYTMLDPASLAAATQAKSIRFDVAIGTSAPRRRGEPFSTEIIFELEGTLHDGTRTRVRHELMHPEGQAPMTAVGVAVGVERLLGLAGGAPVAPGLYLPHVLIEPEYLLRRLQESGTQLRRA